MRLYGKVTADIVDSLASIVGKENILADRLQREGYASDEMPSAKPSLPDVVVKPADTGSVSRVLKLASRSRIPVTPRGAGTGLSGGCIPVFGGIVLSLERMDRIIEIDMGNSVAVVEAGITLERLYEQVEAQGLFYPLYPGEKTATIGGNVATNAGGMNAVRYGVTRHNVLGLEAVLPDGQVIHTGGKFVKCSSGYDLTQLIIGSEGTLAVVTGVTLRLTTRPTTRQLLLAPFSDLQSAIEAVPDILKLEMTPTGIEFIEKNAIEIVEKYVGRELPYHEYDALLLIIMDGKSEAEIHDYFAAVEEICQRHGAAECMVPGGERAARRLLEAREKLYHAIKRYAPMEIADVVVPRNEIAAFVSKVKEISERYHIPVIAYGHCGDGNVHLHPVFQGVTAAEWETGLPLLMRDIYAAGISFGGAVSGEHGIGLAKKAYFMTGTDDALVNIMRRVKVAFDPDDILNPGKIFDPTGTTKHLIST